MARARRGSGLPFTVLVLIFIPLAFSEDLINIVYAKRDPPWWILLAVDGVLLTVILVGALLVSMTVEPPVEKDRTWIWGPAGAALMLVVDVQDRDHGDVLTYFGWLALYLVSLALLVMFMMRISPVRLVRELHLDSGNRVAWPSFQPIVPLLVGTGAAWGAGFIWFNQLGGEEVNRFACGTTPAPSGAVSQEYFAQVSQLIPLILIGVGIEGRYFRTRLKERIPRATIVFTVVWLVVAEALALSALPEPNQGCGGVLYELHEYTAFVLTIEAAFVGLAMLVFALTSRDSSDAIPS